MTETTDTTEAHPETAEKAPPEPQPEDAVTVAKHCPTCDCESTLRWRLRDQRWERESIAEKHERIARYQPVIDEIRNAGGVEGLT